MFQVMSLTVSESEECAMRRVESRVVTAHSGTMKDMAERITELSKWAPGAKAAGALFEMNGYQLPNGSKSGIDGDCAKRVWQKGRATLANAVAVANACEDPETLRMMLKDRRVAVRTEVLKNPHCPWDVLVAKAAWVSSGKREESHTVRYVARDTMRAAVARVSFKTAYSWLGDDQNIDGYTLVATHAKASDDELMEFMDVRYTLQGDRVWNGWSGIMERYDLGQRSNELLMKLAKCDPTAANRAARAGASASRGSCWTTCMRPGTSTQAVLFTVCVKSARSSIRNSMTTSSLMGTAQPSMHTW